MPVTRIEWAKAYATQARSDFAVYEELTRIESVEVCHRLHYLQMACEKIAKAYRLRDTNTAIESTLTRHVAFSRFIDEYLRSESVQGRYSGRSVLLKRISSWAKLFARDIERTAPAVDREATPQNTEYPWVDNDRIICPCDYEFPNLLRLQNRDGQEFLDFIETAFSDFE